VEKNTEKSINQKHSGSVMENSAVIRVIRAGRSFEKNGLFHWSVNFVKGAIITVPAAMTTFEGTRMLENHRFVNKELIAGRPATIIEDIQRQETPAIMSPHDLMTFEGGVGNFF
jgi:hypothetical protein